MVGRGGRIGRTAASRVASTAPPHATDNVTLPCLSTVVTSVRVNRLRPETVAQLLALSVEDGVDGPNGRDVVPVVEKGEW